MNCIPLNLVTYPLKAYYFISLELVFVSNEHYSFINLSLHKRVAIISN